MAEDTQGNLFNWQWPSAKRYPLNNELGKVGKWIKYDLRESDNYLILTGFSSLEYLIQELGSKEVWQGRSINVIIGNEPILREKIIKKSLTKREQDFSANIADYWLEKGISIKQNGSLLSLIQGIEAGNITFSIYHKLHGKMYVGDSHLIMGSSNFSYSGMKS